MTIKPAVDLTIKHEIDLALNRLVGSAARHIMVDIRDHVVILSGYVYSLADCSLAMQAAWCVPGVYNVVDNITLRMH